MTHDEIHNIVKWPKLKPTTISSNNVWSSSTTVTNASASSKIHMSKDQILVIDDKEFTGAQLARMLELLERLMKEQYPEEMI